MDGHRELHLRVRGTPSLHLPGKPLEPLDVYCIASYGHVRHRTRLIEDTLSPDWNEEFVFDAAALLDSTSPIDPVVKFEIFSQGLWRDELLLCAYLDLEVCGLLDSLQQLRDVAVRHRTSTIASHRSSSTAANDGTVLPEDASAVAAAAAASRRGSDTATAKVPGAAAAEAAVDKANATATSAAFRASCSTAGTGCPGFSTEVRTHMLPLLAAHHGSSSCSLQSRAMTKSVIGERSLAATHLRRSGNHVSSAEGGELEVAAWWVQQPSPGNTGSPPRIISFVHPPDAPQPLPSVTHTTLSSQWEEPALAFVRVVVKSVDLGSAAAAAGTAGGSTVHHSKLVLRRMKSLLKAGVESGNFEAEQDAERQEHQRPTLSDIHRPASLSVTYRQGAAVASSSAAEGLAGQYVLEYQASDYIEEPSGSGSDDEKSHHEGVGQLGNSRSGGWKGKTSHQREHDRARGLGREKALGVFRRSTGDGELAGTEECTGYTLEATDEDIEIVSLPGFEGGTSASLQQQQPGIKTRKAQRKALKRQQDQQLYLTVKIQLGNQKPKALRSVPLSPDGSAEIEQAAVFAVTRPLNNAWISYHVGLGLGPRGVQLLGYRFEYNLLHLLRRSPERPLQLQQWRDVARCTVNGLQVPLPCLPESCLDTSAFLADADYRAGMYLIPPVSQAALDQAARDDAEAAAAAAAAATAAEQDEDEPLTDSESEAGNADDITSQERMAIDGASGTGRVYASSRVSESGSAGTAASGSQRGVLRRREAAAAAAGLAQQQQQPGKARSSDSDAGSVKRVRSRPRWQEKLKDRATAGVDKVLVRVEGRFNEALDKLPAGVAQHVKESNFMKRVLPSARRSEVFSLGQLRVLTFKNSAPAAAAESSTPTAQPPHQWSAGSAVPGAGLQQHSSYRNDGPSCNLGAADGSAAAAVALQDHSNLATAGSSATRPLGILQLTLQSVTLRTSSNLMLSTPGVQLLMRCGPHWLQLQQAALPITFHNASGSTNITAATGSSSGPLDPAASFTAASSGSKVASVQVLVPVFGSSSLVTLVLHRKGSVFGRCVFKLYGLLPLLLRDHTKTLTLYSDKRGPGGQRVIAGTVLVRLAAGPPAGYTRFTACIRLAYSYLITPHTLEMHTSGVLATMSRDERDDAAGEVIVEWLASAGQQGRHALPESLVDQLVSTGRGHVSGSRMRGHVRRIKAVLLDWLPRRYDPLAFYYWKRPTHNLLALWVISHACLYPAKWLLVMALVVTLTLLRRMAIQIRRGVLGFELEQLPPDMGAAAGLTHQQQQEQPGIEPSGGCSPTNCGETADNVDCPTGLRSHGAQFGDMSKYKEAADKLRAKISEAASGKSKTPATPPQPAAFPKTLQDLRQQLEAGTLDLDSLDVEALAERLLSVSGLLKLARQHSIFVWSYALVAQNMLDDAAGFAEGVYAMLTAQDPLAALLFCGIMMSSAAFCYIFGVGAGTFLIVCVLLRPPMLRGVPGVFGWKALLANLPSRSVEELAW